ncbi:LuxR C-terminal-related transcriptional regulator [Phyllobacterium sp. KW56]|nr:LuxR C-terminal-related transcriptional regulator [Phyllobacterium sp. KW56]
MEVLRQGKANKTIAYALRLAPNTVKVHVRNILKKVRATNRAEAIYKINAMFDEIA